MQLVQKLESDRIPGLRQANGFRFRQCLGRLRRVCCDGIAWSVSGQRSNSGASTLSDAPDTSRSCLCNSPHYRGNTQRAFITRWVGAPRTGLAILSLLGPFVYVPPGLAPEAPAVGRLWF